MSMFDLSGLFDDPDTLMRNQQAQMAAVNEMLEKVNATVGEASSQDDRIHVEWSEGDGVRLLELNPRALRLSSDELAAEIRDVVNRARADASAKVAEAVEGAEGLPSADDAQSMIDEMPKVQGFLDDVLRDTSRLGGELEHLVERMQTRAGVDPADLEDDASGTDAADRGQGRPSAS